MSDKEILLARSALYRRQLRRDAADLRDCRAVRMVVLAGRIALFAKRAYSAIAFASKRLGADPKRRVRYRTD